MGTIVDTSKITAVTLSVIGAAMPDDQLTKPGHATAAMLGYGYAAVLAAGGLMGFMKKGSQASLCMGLVLGGLSAYGAYQLSSNRSNYTLLLACSSTTAAVMGYRAFSSGKLMPAGIATGLSLAMVGYLYFAVIRNKRYQYL